MYISIINLLNNMLMLHSSPIDNQCLLINNQITINQTRKNDERLNNEIDRLRKENLKIQKQVEKIYLDSLIGEFKDLDYHSYINPNIKLFYREIILTPEKVSKELSIEIDSKLINKTAQYIANRQNNYIIVFVDKIDGKSIITIAVSKQITNNYKANDVAKELCKNINAKGGGNSFLAQVSTKETFNKGELEIFILEILFTIS